MIKDFIENKVNELSDTSSSRDEYKFLKRIHKVLKAGVLDTSCDKIILSLRDILLTTVNDGVDPSIIRCTATQGCIYKFCKKSKSKSLTRGSYYYTFPNFKLD